MNKKLYIIFISFVFILLSSDVCIAGPLDDINQQFFEAASAWQSIIIKYATKLFWILAPISLVLTAGDAWLKGQISDATSFFAHFISTCIFLGFFLWLLQNGPSFAKAIIDSMAEIGKQASGLDSKAPGDLMTSAFGLFQKIVKLPIDGVAALGIFLGAVLIGIPILIIVALIAVNLTIEYCAAWIVLYAGAFVLGFGSTRWTSDMAIAYFKTVLATALRIMSMIFLIGIISSLLTSKMSLQSLKMEDLAELLVYAIIFLSLMNTVPNLIASMVGGGQGASNLGAGSIMAAAGLASAGIAASSGLLPGGSLGSVGGDSPLKQSTEKAEVAFEALESAFSGSSSSDSGPVFNSNPTQFATPVSNSASSSPFRE